jgi:hypothetical protein
VLFEDFLGEGFVVAEDVLDVSEDSVCCERESSDATEEVDVCDFFIGHISLIATMI